jgi:KUP system potassium uptake protein
MVSLVALIIWRINFFIVFFFFLVFACLDGVYLSSALTKVPKGAWFTILLGAILSVIFVLWRFGKENQWAAEKEDRFQLTHLLEDDGKGESKLTEQFGGMKISTVGGVGIFFDKIGDMVPIVFTQFVTKFSARPQVIVWFHLRPLSTPSIPESERYIVQRTSVPHSYRITVRHGYRDDIVSPDLARLVIEQLVLFITRDTGRPSFNGSAQSVEHSPEVQQELFVLTKAAQEQMVYVMGKEQMRIKAKSGWMRKGLLKAFLWIRENSRTKMADMDIPFDQMVEVGFVKEI